MKIYSAEKFLEILRDHFPKLSDFTCVNNAYTDFTYRFV